MTGQDDMLDRIMLDPLYRRMCGVHRAQIGNLAEHTRRETAAIQLATLVWVVANCGVPQLVVETGANKGLFGLTLAHILPEHHPWQYHTCDVLAEAGDAVAMLDSADRGVRGFFYHGPSQEQLPLMLKAIGRGPDLAWVDGDHSYEGALFDLTTLGAAGAEVILVDDVALIEDVARAVQTFLESPAGARYRHYAVEWPIADAEVLRGIAVLGLAPEPDEAAAGAARSRRRRRGGGGGETEA